MSCERTPGSGGFVSSQPFTNWAGTVRANPQRIYRPTTVDQLVAIVKEAESTGARVRAVGSGWSFTDIMVTPDYLVFTDELKAILSETLSGDPYPNDPVFGALTLAARTRFLCHVQAGIKIHHLHDQLETNEKFKKVLLNDGPSGSPQRHGYALKTLGGSGGQSIVGAMSTSTHGGDDHDGTRSPIRALPDMVLGIHLVAAGGAEFFIQRGADPIVDPAALATSMPCVAGRVISDDEVFNAVVVSMGRMGIIHSVVLEVRQQYVLTERVSQDTWRHVSSGQVIADLRARNRFLQILILPYANPDGDHTCFITTRNEITPSSGPTPGKGFDPFSLVCETPPAALAAVVAGMIGALSSAIALLLAIPVVGPALADADIGLITLLSPLLAPSVTIGDYLAAAVNLITQDRFDWAATLVNTILSGALAPGVRQDLSYKIMDTYDYAANCYKALSLEVAFNADENAYRDYIEAVFNLIDDFVSRKILVGAYISLRYCAGSEALLAIEQWPHTVCIEISSLGGLAHGQEVLDAFEQEAANRGATVHWGQSNSRSRFDIEKAFPGNIDLWRATLARLSAHGRLNTFDNDFCVTHGLEVFETVHGPTGRDVSYLFPLLLG